MIDNVIVSTDTSPYKDFLPLVSKAWKKFLPEAELVIGHATDEPDYDFLKYGFPVDFSHVIPSGNLAKISRMMCAYMVPGTNMLSDMDMVPLQRAYFEDAASKHIPGNLTVLSADAYDQDDRYPICYLIADRETWLEIVNPKGYEYWDLINAWLGYKLDQKDDPSKTPFSDESLLRYLIKEWNHPERITLLNRVWHKGIADKRIDRSRWMYTHAILNGYYIDAHMPRPYNKGKLKDIIYYIGGDHGL